MKITLRIAAGADARAAILRDAELARTRDATGTILEIDADDPRLDRFLELTKDGAGAWFNPVTTFTPAELAGARYVQADCRGKIVLESPRDNEANRARVDALDFARADGTALRIKIVDRLTFSEANVAPNAIACASNWMPEFLVGTAVAAAFGDAGLTGFELRPVYTPNGDPLGEVFHLYTGAIMPAARIDATTIRQKTATESWRELGCLTYAIDRPLPDFNRTAENFSNNHLPLWIVSARVRDCVQRAKIKGWAFRPVLEPGTPLHAAYTQVWTDLFARIAINPRNRF